MTTQHTPGPWVYSFVSAKKAREEYPGTDGGGGGGYIKSREKTISFLPHHRDIKEDLEREANARLIAAAPELLAACECVLLRDEISDSALEDMLRRVIKKAKGE